MLKKESNINNSHHKQHSRSSKIIYTSRIHSSTRVMFFIFFLMFEIFPIFAYIGYSQQFRFNRTNVISGSQRTFQQKYLQYMQSQNRLQQIN